MPDPVVHFEIVGKDARSMQDFYRQAFGWQMQSVMPDYAMAHPGGESGINGGVGGAQEGQPGYVTFYIEVPDLQEALERIEQLGGKTVREPFDVPEGPSLAMFTDPDGNLIGLLKAGSAQGS